MDKRLMKELAEKYPQYIPEPYGRMIETMGIDAVSTFTEAFGGTNMYIPHSRTIFSGCVEQQIKSEYNGMNLHYLCQKYDYCYKTVKAMLLR